MKIDCKKCHAYTMGKINPYCLLDWKIDFNGKIPKPLSGICDYPKTKKKLKQMEERLNDIKFLRAMR